MSLQLFDEPQQTGSAKLICTHDDNDRELLLLAQSSAKNFPFQNLLPEIRDYIVDFLDPITMLQALQVDQQFYFRVVNSNLYKAFRLIMCLYKSSIVLSGANPHWDINDFPSDENLTRCAVDYFLRFKYMRASCLDNYYRFTVKNMDNCPESQLRKIDRCLSMVVQNFKVYSTKALFKSPFSPSNSVTVYRLLPKEFELWNMLIELLESSVDNGELNPDVHEKILESVTFPRGPKEMDLYTESEYPKHKIVKQKLWKERKTDQWLSNFYGSFKNFSPYYLLARLSLLPFGNVPEELKSDKNFVSFFIEHYKQLDGEPTAKIMRMRNFKNFEKVYLVPSLSGDRELIQKAFNTRIASIYESVFESSCYGTTENRVLDKDDYAFFGRIFKIDPTGITFLINYNITNAQKYNYTENDLIEIIKIAPESFKELPEHYKSFEKHPNLCKEAVSRLGENFSAVVFSKKVSVEENGDLFKVAARNLKNKEVFNTPLFNNLDKELQEDATYLKEVALIYPTICKNFKTKWLENQMDLMIHVASVYPVLDHLFAYDPRRNFKSTLWELRYGENTENRKHVTPDFLTSNLEFAKNTLKSFPYQLGRFPQNIQDNDEICSIIVESGCDLTSIPIFYRKVKNNRDWIKKSIEYGTNIFLFEENVYNDPELFQIAIKINPRMLSMSEKFQKDRDMVLHTIQCCRLLKNEQPTYMSFQYIDSSLLEDDEIVERAILETPTFVDIGRLPARFQSNTKLTRATLFKYPSIYRQLPTHLQENLEFAELAVRGNAINFNSLPKQLQQNRDFFLLAISRGYNYNQACVTFEPLETDYIKWNYDSSNPKTIRLV